MSKLPLADTYTDLIAVCPHCNKHNNIEWFDDGPELEAVVCEQCSGEFECRLPESNYH